MTEYRVKFYRGDYGARQAAANRGQAVCYVEHHFNSTGSPTADYACVVVGKNASAASKNWGGWYAARVAKVFNTKIVRPAGILVGGYQGRGNYNLIKTEMPAILLEPLFCSNPTQAKIIRSGEGRDQLARILAESIRKFFPAGGLVAFSVGHKYKSSAPNDRGAAVRGGGTEADYAEMVLLLAKHLLENNL